MFKDWRSFVNRHLEVREQMKLGELFNSWKAISNHSKLVKETALIVFEKKNVNLLNKCFAGWQKRTRSRELLRERINAGMTHLRHAVSRNYLRNWRHNTPLIFEEPIWPFAEDEESVLSTPRWLNSDPHFPASKARSFNFSKPISKSPDSEPDVDIRKLELPRTLNGHFARGGLNIKEVEREPEPVLYVRTTDGKIIRKQTPVVISCFESWKCYTLNRREFHHQVMVLSQKSRKQRLKSLIDRWRWVVAKQKSNSNEPTWR
eukprot:TRINITY_DN3108_c0_g2_i1.p1 TRINITY_DN3108_c0_g2~~TRINITY_DN3108_c0_g2_i1.p1  ORF type:complete len:277 (+),score=53.42 TRINITY_DN3108_c0_g2_i1:49-831(+)